MLNAQLFSIKNKLRGDGVGDPYDRYLVGEGLYTVTVKSTDEVVYYGFGATQPGVYRIESWSKEVDTFIGDYGANDFYVPANPMYTDDNSGQDNNFSYEIELKRSLFVERDDGSLQSGARRTLGFSAKSESYPVSFPVVFMRIRDSYEEPEPVIVEVKVSETLTKFPDQSGTITPTMMDGSDVPVYNSKDRFYHLGTEDGPLIVAKISKPCEYVDFSFNTVQDEGNKYLTLERKYDYTKFIDTYAEYCNKDGVYPVTEELMLFLQRAQHTHMYFGYGGWVQDQLSYKPLEEYYWMFAAYYYAA